MVPFVGVTRYELLDRIGVGGMAEIFRGKAVAAGGFEKPVAIKRILPHLSQDPRFVELLIAEAKVLSLLKHRNITQIFDVGLGDDQQYFLVMEYVDGKDLGAIQRVLEQRRKRVPFDLALHVGAEICEALEHAHSARAPDGKAMSLVHRDISPSNVLLSRAGEVKLTDFGIAKRAEQEQTKGGAVKGKFAYISPEQARNEHLDPRSDVFSVGILLWELICNRPLFSRLTDMEALRGVRDPAKIPPPSTILAGERGFDARLLAEVDALVMGALSPEAARRPTAGMFGAKIRSLRYSLDETVGDPATELAKLIEAAEQVERESVVIPVANAPLSFDDLGENTVIRIRTADAFSMRDKDGAGMAKARQVIDRFEEEETRLAALTADQMRQLRGGGRPDTGPVKPPAPAKRSQRPTDEPTVARAPMSFDDESATFAATPQSVRDALRDTPTPHGSLDSDEHTRLVAPRDKRTPVPQRVPKPQPPPPQPPPPPPPPPPPVAIATPLPQAGVWNAQPPMAMAPLPMAPPQPPMAPPQPPMAPLYPQGPMPNPYQPPAPPQAPAHPAWGAPPPQGAFERPSYASVPQRPSMPQVAGFGTPKRGGLRPWMLVVGALLVAGLAFALTRAFIGSKPKAAITDKKTP